MRRRVLTHITSQQAADGDALDIRGTGQAGADLMAGASWPAPAAEAGGVIANPPPDPDVVAGHDSTRRGHGRASRLVAARGRAVATLECWSMITGACRCRLELGSWPGPDGHAGRRAADPDQLQLNLMGRVTQTQWAAGLRADWIQMVMPHGQAVSGGTGVSCCSSDQPKHGRRAVTLPRGPRMWMGPHGSLIFTVVGCMPTDHGHSLRWPYRQPTGATIRATGRAPTWARRTGVDEDDQHCVCRRVIA